MRYILFYFVLDLKPVLRYNSGFTGDIVISKTRRKVQIGGWIRFHIQELHVVLLKRLQEEVESLLRVRVENPRLDVRGRQELLVRVVEILLEQ